MWGGYWQILKFIGWYSRKYDVGESRQEETPTVGWGTLLYNYYDIRRGRLWQEANEKTRERYMYLVAAELVLEGRREIKEICFWAEREYLTIIEFLPNQQPGLRDARRSRRGMGGDLFIKDEGVILIK